MSVIQRSKSTVYGLTTDLNNIKNAGGFDANLNYLSIPTANYISGATSVRHATELLDTKAKALQDAIDLANTNNGNSLLEITTDLGDVSTLSTTSKEAVGAINELDGEIGDLSTVSIADGSATDIAGMINDLEAAKLDKSANLSDVTDVQAARNNLSVYSQSEVDASISAAQLAMGTNFDVADIAARDALTNLDVADRVFVSDDGDAKWALYKVQAVDANGAGTAWTKIMDQDSLENSISASSIKAAYESNADTNAFTDADVVKTGFISITSARDLDLLIQSDELNTSVLLAGASNTTIASDLAVKTYVDNEAAKLLEISNNLSDVADVATARTNLDVYSKSETDAAINTGGATFKTEVIVVSTDTITLSYAPKNGVIFNFATVRHVDVNGVAYDIPTTPTADPKVFNIHPDAAGDFDTKSVTVQYAHIN